MKFRFSLFLALAATETFALARPMPSGLLNEVSQELVDSYESPLSRRGDKNREASSSSGLWQHHDPLAKQPIREYSEVSPLLAPQNQSMSYHTTGRETSNVSPQHPNQVSEDDNNEEKNSSHIPLSHPAQSMSQACQALQRGISQSGEALSHCYHESSALAGSCARHTAHAAQILARIAQENCNRSTAREAQAFCCICAALICCDSIMRAME